MQATSVASLDILNIKRHVNAKAKKIKKAIETAGKIIVII